MDDDSKLLIAAKRAIEILYDVYKGHRTGQMYYIDDPEIWGVAERLDARIKQLQAASYRTQGGGLKNNG